MIAGFHGPPTPARQGLIFVPLLNMTSAAPLSLCGVECVVTKERSEKRAQRESYLKGIRRLLYKIFEQN